MASRRAQGEGSIRKRTDRVAGGQVRWVATLELGWKDGKRQRKSIYGKTRNEVSKALQQTMKDRDKGLVVAGGPKTLAEFVHAWLAEIKADKAPKTWRDYDGQMRLHVLPALGHLPLRNITVQQVKGLMLEKRKGLSPRTVNSIRSVLRNALNDAMRQSLVERNVAALAEPARAERTERTWLTADQARQLLAAAQGNPESARLTGLYTIALSLGLRQGELCGLRWQDVDLEHRQLRVTHGLQRIDGTLQLVRTKSDSSRRVLVLPGIAHKALTEHQDRQRSERGHVLPLVAGDGYVFTMPTGGPIDPDYLRRSFKRLLTAARLPDIRFHDLRHSAASLLLAEGVPMRVIMDTLGHSQISITSDLYSHVAPAHSTRRPTQPTALLAGWHDPVGRSQRRRLGAATGPASQGALGAQRGT